MHERDGRRERAEVGGGLAEEAREAGADIVGAEELVDEVVRGRLAFERCLATPDLMPVLAKAARVLGPKGLMPNVKRGSATTDIGDAVRRAKSSAPGPDGIAAAHWRALGDEAVAPPPIQRLLRALACCTAQQTWEACQKETS